MIEVDTMEPARVTKEYQCWQSPFGYSRHCAHQQRATHCFHHCGTEGMGTPVYGDDNWFCSLSCYKGHLLETPSYAHQAQLQTLSERARQEFGVTKSIKPAPPRSALAMFGGSLTTQEFLGVCGDPKVEVVVLHNNDITENTVIEVRRQQTDKEGFQQMFATTQAPVEHQHTTNSLFDQLAANIEVERKQKIASSQGKFIFKAMNGRKKSTKKDK